MLTGVGSFLQAAGTTHDLPLAGLQKDRVQSSVVIRKLARDSASDEGDPPLKSCGGVTYDLEDDHTIILVVMLSVVLRL